MSKFGSLGAWSYPAFRTLRPLAIALVLAATLGVQRHAQAQEGKAAAFHEVPASELVGKPGAPIRAA
ncbi:MAG TPA: hypothetical protein VK844_09325 [Hyphomicrobiales bacterium]|nr:hypothetical protein [Hyphomicrobiales bacterium]